jgi:hypothetical protein
MAWFLSKLKIVVDSELEATDRHAAVGDRHPAHQVAGRIEAEPYGRSGNFSRFMLMPL